MPTSHELSITVREVVPHGDELRDHTQILHGQAPGPDGETQNFHLGISASGDRLLLFRAGHLPQALMISELVGEWLLAANGRRLTHAAVVTDEGDSAEQAGADACRE